MKALRDKVSIEFKPNWEHSLAEMAIQLDDGTTLEATHDSGIPWADVAKQRQAIETKFESLVTPGPRRRRHASACTTPSSASTAWTTSASSRARRRRASKPHPERGPQGRLEGGHRMMPTLETASRLLRMRR